MQNGPELRGFERVMASEIHVSDLLQEITDRDPTPWNELINLVPIDCFREHPFTRFKKANSVPGSIDLLLVSSDDTEVLIEVKLSHHFSDDQRERYESSGGDVLCLLGMEADRDWVARFPRWTFMSLESVFKAWIDSHDEKAATLAQMAATTLEEWNYGVNSVFRDNKRGETLDQINRRFLATLVARRLFLEIMELGWFARHSKSVGSGMPIVQGFAPLNDDLNRCLIAEARWLTSYETINIRFGVDFSDLSNSKESRLEAWNLAKSMDAAIRLDALAAHLRTHRPDLADVLNLRGRGGRGTPNDEIWMPVVEHGFDGTNRRTRNPGFAGDGTLQFEASGAIVAAKVDATDVRDLIDQALRWLCTSLPNSYAAPTISQTDEQTS